MKQLIFVRHAKSSWEYDVSDKQRPLKNRGITDAQLVSNAFLKHNIQLDGMYSSPANRAFSTCKIFLQTLQLDQSQVIISEDLYDFGGSSVLNFIKKLDDTLNSVILFGHNHAFTALVNNLGDRYVDNFPTSGLAIISFDIDQWQFVKHGQTKTLIFPRDLKR